MLNFVVVVIVFWMTSNVWWPLIQTVSLAWSFHQVSLTASQGAANMTSHLLGRVLKHASERAPPPTPSFGNHAMDPDMLVLLLRQLQAHQSENSIKVQEHSVSHDNIQEIPVQTFERPSDLNRANIASELSITEEVANNDIPSVVPPFKTDGPSGMEIDRFVELLRYVQPPGAAREN